MRPPAPLSLLLAAVLLLLGTALQFRTRSSAPVIRSPAPKPAEAVRQTAAEATPAAPARPVVAPAPRAEAAARPQPESTALADFRTWAELAAKGAAVDPTFGRALARERRTALAELIAKDPERALAEAIPPVVRQRLPAEVVAQLEQPLSARADLRIVAALADDPEATPAVRREVVLPDGTTYAASLYGARLRQPTTSHIPLHGIVLDGRMAVAENPVRVLAKGERLPAGAPVEFSCPVSGNATMQTKPEAAVAEEDIAAEIGGTIHFFCQAGHLADRTAQLRAAVEAAGTPDSAYNQGVKRVLLARLNFTDDLAEPITVAGGNTLLAAVDAFIGENSYGTTRIDLVNSLVTPVVITMPKTKAVYRTENNSISFLADARAAAAAAGYNYLNYDFEWFRYASVYGFGGQAYVGARGVWLQSSSTGVAAHEWGHNLGVWHANRWVPTSDNIFGGGSNSEYGDSYDTMGSAAAGKNSFNACFRYMLGWLPEANVTTVTASGTYRIHAFDQPTLGANTPLALRTIKDATRFYWLEHRLQWNSNATMANGVLMHWSPWASSNNGTHLLDLTPNSAGGNNDAALVLGRTFSDRYAGVHLTPVARNASTTPPSLDIVVQRGNFLTNRAPVLAPLSPSATSVAVNATVNFTAAASDPDGDALAYWWDFSNGAVGPNAANASASWSTAGHYVVRCVVSDLKGRSASRLVLITVGTPTTFTASGQVLDDYGQPVLEARVHNGVSGAGARSAFTDGEGRYILTGLTAGSYSLGVVWPGFTGAGTPVFANPVTVGPSAANLDFTGTNLGPIIHLSAPATGPRENGTVPARFTFQRGPEAPATRSLTVNYTLGGTADKASDYTVTPVPPASGTYNPATGAGTLELPVGATVAELQLTPVNDALPEGAENVICTVASGTGYQLGGTTTAACTIVDNDAPDYYTETFSSTLSTLRPFDLSGRRLTFTPTSATAYAGTSDAAAAFAVDPAGATVLAANGAATVPLTTGTLTGGFWQISGLGAAAPKVFGQTFTTVFINTHGNLTFGSGDTSAPSSTSQHFVNGRRRVTLFGAFLDLRRGGTVSWQLASAPARLIVTYANVPVSGTGTAVLNAQVELGADGVIALTHVNTTLTDGLVGLAGGTSAPNPFYNSDLSAYAPTPVGYSAWLAARFTAAELGNDLISGPGADPDGDGWSNLFECALGGDPRAGGLPPGAPVMSSAAGYASLTFQRLPQFTELTYAVDATSDLGSTWVEIARSVAGNVTVAAPGQTPSTLQETPTSGAAVTVTVGDTTPMNANSQRFLRLRVLR